MNENERDDSIRLLIVEDDQDLADLLAMVLARRGLTVRTAANGFDALDALGRWKPDVALIDLGLPDMDGCALAQRIGSDGPALVAHTGEGGAARRRLVREAGFAAHVLKPAKPSALAELLVGLGLEQRALAVTAGRRSGVHPLLQIRRSRNAHAAA